MNFPLGLPSLHATATSRRVWEGQSDPLLRGEQNKLWDTGCVYFIVRILHPKTFTLAMTSSRLFPSSDSHCMFYHLNFSGLLRQRRGEGIGKIIVRVSLMSWGYRLWEFPFANSAINLWSLRLLKHKPPKLLEMSNGANNSASFLIKLTWL